MTENVASGRIRVNVQGRTRCTMSKPATATWTRIDTCEEAVK